MGTITPRKRQDGTIGYTAQIRLKRGGNIIHTEAQTFDRKPAAAAWLKKREGELVQPGALDRLAVDDPPLADVIDQIYHVVPASVRTHQGTGAARNQRLRHCQPEMLAGRQRRDFSVRAGAGEEGRAADGRK